jgi:hypothetical protein
MWIYPLLVLGAFAAGLSGQGRPPGLPVTPPPVDHPGLWAQPLYERPGKGGGDSGGPSTPAGRQPAVPVDPEIAGPQLAGKDLQTATAKVMTLTWHRSLPAVLAAAKAADKPVFWLQALGELDGLASSTLQSMRGLTLANDVVFARLRDQFVLGYANIERQPYVGLSQGYEPDQTAMGATNGSGGRNLQLAILAADGTVMLALPGFWHALDLLSTLDLAVELHRLHGSAEHSHEQKLAMARSKHETFLKRIGAGMSARSAWQNRDVVAERDRSDLGMRDTYQRDPAGGPLRNEVGQIELRPLLQVLHERVGVLRFTAIAAMPWEALVDYGHPQFDANAAMERGRTFSAAAANHQRRERERKSSR